MAIYTYTAENATTIQCDMCGMTEATSKCDGVVPADWVTGHLWIDVSLQKQKQTPLCFCPECGAKIIISENISIRAEGASDAVELNSPAME